MIDGGYFPIPLAKDSSSLDWRGNCILVLRPSVDAWGNMVLRGLGAGLKRSSQVERNARAPPRKRAGRVDGRLPGAARPSNMVIVRNNLVTVKSCVPNRAARRANSGRLLILCLLVLVAPALLAESPYLKPGRPDGVSLLAPPPAPGSAEEAADLASARAVFQARTPAEEARAFKDASLSIFLYAPAIGEFFQPGKFPKTEAFFQKVKTDLAEPINTTKDHWKRKRPYQLDPQLALGRPERSFGYPSGHSTRGMVQALLLAELFPQQKEGILAIGRDIGWDRVLIGKHFPTDVHAARVLAQAIVRELLASAAFQRDLAEAKAEARACVAANAANAGLQSHGARLNSKTPLPAAGGK